MTRVEASTGSGAWTEPGVETVAPGVHRIPLPLPLDGLRAVNVYVLETPDGLVLVDGGWDVPAARQALDAGLGRLGAAVADVRRVLVTHVHRDHYTLACALGREQGARVGLGRGERENVRLVMDPEGLQLSGQVDRLRQLGAHDLALLVVQAREASDGRDEGWRVPDEWLQPGELTLGGGRVLDVVETPGHTAGHVVFHDLAGGLLFAGDHVLPTITPSLGLETAVSPDPLGSFLTSLALVRSRPDAVLLPAHGGVAASVHARVDELLEHHSRRLDEALGHASGNGSSGWEVAQRLRWTRRERRLDELDVFNQMLAVLETGAHLHVLVAQGRLRVVPTEQGDRYT
jgi:glyoxylase-like metal-dependent hydrolase (beta-lactamase superfamily II)